MTKKKRTNKTAGGKSKKKSQKKSGKARLKKETNPAEVRKQVSRIVEAAAVNIAQAVVGEAEKGQLAPTRYLFEMANIFPPQANGEQATEQEDCLAKILLARIDAPVKPEKEKEDEPEDAVDESKKSALSPASASSSGIDGPESANKETVQERVGMATSVT